MNEPTLRDILDAIDGMRTRFDRLDGQFEGIDAQFQGINAQFEGIDAQFQGINAQFQGIDAQFQRINAQFQGIDAQFQGINGQFQGVNDRFGVIEVTLAQHGQALSELSADVREVRTIVNGHTRQLERIERMQRTETKTLDDHERRIAGLEAKP